MNKNDKKKKNLEKKLKDDFASYSIFLGEAPTSILYREFVLPKKTKQKPFERYIFIEKKKLKNLSFNQIYDFVNKMLKDKKEKNRVQNLEKFLKSKNIIYTSGIWEEDDDDDEWNTI